MYAELFSGCSLKTAQARSLGTGFLVLGILRFFRALPENICVFFSQCRLAAGAEKRKRESLVLRMRPFQGGILSIPS